MDRDIVYWLCIAFVTFRSYTLSSFNINPSMYVAA